MRVLSSIHAGIRAHTAALGPINRAIDRAYEFLVPSQFSSSMPFSVFESRRTSSARGQRRTSYLSVRVYFHYVRYCVVRLRVYTTNRIRAANYAPRRRRRRDLVRVALAWLVFLVARGELIGELPRANYINT